MFAMAQEFRPRPPRDRIPIDVLAKDQATLPYRSEQVCKGDEVLVQSFSDPMLVQ